MTAHGRLARAAAAPGSTRPRARAVLPVVVLAAVLTWPAAQAAGNGNGNGNGNGDVTRGAAIAASRQQGLCVLCHALPGQAAVFQGDIGPPLAGVGSRLSPDLLRQRLLAPGQFNPETVMPSYGRSDEALQRVPAALRGQPLLSPTQVDDVVAWLASLK